MLACSEEQQLILADYFWAFVRIAAMVIMLI